MDIKRNIKDAARQLGLDKGTLKKAQVQAIEAAVRGNDVFLVAPTGFGKSAVFQATALLQKGVTVVIGPAALPAAGPGGETAGAWDQRGILLLGR